MNFYSYLIDKDLNYFFSKYVFEDKYEFYCRSGKCLFVPKDIDFNSDCFDDIIMTSNFGCQFRIEIINKKDNYINHVSYSYEFLKNGPIADTLLMVNNVSNYYYNDNFKKTFSRCNVPDFFFDFGLDNVEFDKNVNIDSVIIKREPCKVSYISNSDNYLNVRKWISKNYDSDYSDSLLYVDISENVDCPLMEIADNISTNKGFSKKRI